jgi:hypothetical protein
MRLKIALAAVAMILVLATAFAAPVKQPLTPKELKQARDCLKGKTCYLTCNRAHDAGRDDLIRKGACGE